GYAFASETDPEVLCNLVAYHYAKEPEPTAPEASRFLESVRKTLRHVDGTYGIVVLCLERPGEFVAARKGSPLIVGVGSDEHRVASDVSSLVGRTQNVVYLQDGELVHVRADGFVISTLDDAEVSVSPVIDTDTWKVEDADLGEYAHYMEKEILEPPAAL